ncbi:MAG TPA: hypothetical protein VGN57_10030 [Pirellulaceae bacterium]|nr:hypothetical protein [Pirellulaceae bacterium]
MWRLNAPDGAVVSEFVELRSWSGKPGDNALADVTDLVFDSEELDFDPDRRKAFANLILNEPEVVDVRTLSHELPRTVIKVDGKYLSLPIESVLTAP